MFDSTVHSLRPFWPFFLQIVQIFAYFGKFEHFFVQFSVRLGFIECRGGNLQYNRKWLFSNYATYVPLLSAWQLRKRDILAVLSLEIWSCCPASWSAGQSCQKQKHKPLAWWNSKDHLCNTNGKMPPPRNHEENRAMVCALCIGEHGEKAKRKINAKEKKQIIIEDYSTVLLLQPTFAMWGYLSTTLSLSPWAHIFLEIFQ